MQKKFKESPPSGGEKKSTSPYKKGAKKKTNQGVIDAAKKYFAKHPDAKGQRPFAKKDKPANNFKPKKFVKPAEEENEIFSTEEKVSDETRLNKYLAHAGVASRRNADELIREGRVKVNGTVVTEMGYKVKLNDEVEFDGKTLTLEKNITSY